MRLDVVGVGCHGGIADLRVVRPEEPVKAHGLLVCQVDGLDAHLLAQRLVDVVGTELRPVVVGAEVDVLVHVIADGRPGVDRPHRGLVEAVEVGDRLLLVGTAQLGKGLVVEHRRVVGGEHRVHLGLTGERLRAGVDRARVALHRLLAEVVDAVGGPVVHVKAVHDLVLDVGRHGVLGGDLDLLALLGLGRLGRLLHVLLALGRQLVGDHVASDHLGTRVDTVARLEPLVRRHERLAQRVGVRVPQREIARERPVEKALEREGRELCELAHLHAGGGGTGEERKAHDEPNGKNCIGGVDGGLPPARKGPRARRALRAPLRPTGRPSRLSLGHAQRSPRTGSR